MKIARLIYDNSADWFYATQMDLPDPAVWYQAPSGETHIILSALEVDRGRKVAQANHIHAMDAVAKTLKASGARGSTLDQVLWLLEKDKPEVVEIPADFPAYLLVQLQERKVNVKVADGIFFPARALKTSAEIEHLRATQRMNELGFTRAVEILTAADIAADDTLFWQGTALTSEIMQGEIKAVQVRHGAKSFDGGPIFACAAQSADPHERGHGVLKAHQFIIMDSFPQGAHFYYGDLTRTFVKGTASQWHTDVYNAVLNAQLLALTLIKEGANGKDIHTAVAESLVKSGFPTGVDETGANFGFFHGTGHSVGLEVHDPGPRTISRVDCTLQAGMITSVEPGLYYPGKGGCRIEDVVAVTKDGHDNLTTFPKDKWQIS